MGLSTILSLVVYCFYLRLSLYQCCKYLHGYPAKISQGVTVHLDGLDFKKGFRGMLQVKCSHLLTSLPASETLVRTTLQLFGYSIYWLGMLQLFSLWKKPLHLYNKLDLECEHKAAFPSVRGSWFLLSSLFNSCELSCNHDLPRSGGRWVPIADKAHEAHEN